MPSVCPFRVARSRPVSRSHSLIVVSDAPVAIRLPSRAVSHRPHDAGMFREKWDFLVGDFPDFDEAIDTAGDDMVTVLAEGGRSHPVEMAPVRLRLLAGTRCRFSTA